MTPYSASQYAEKLSTDQLECEKCYGTYNNMKRLLLQWQEKGIVKLKPIDQSVRRISRIEVLPSGLDLLKKLDGWYGTPNT